VRFLVDAVFPAAVEHEAPTGVEFVRWSDGDISDNELLRVAVEQSARGVVLFDRNSLSQEGLIELADELGVALIAVEANDPIKAKDRLIKNFNEVRRELAVGQFVLVLGGGARQAMVE